MSLITIIIPLHNRAQLILDTLQCLRAVFHPGITLEIIVVDDASTDRGAQMVEAEFPEVKLILNKEKFGAQVCRNKGLEIAQGEYVFFLDSDDLIEPHFFEAKVDLLSRNLTLIGAYGPFEYFESENQFREELIRPRHTRYPLLNSDSNGQIMMNLLEGWFIPANAILWRTRAVRAIGGYNEALLINQDVDLCFRMLLSGNICGVNGARALIRIHGGEQVGRNNSEKKIIQILELRKYFVKSLRHENKWTNEFQEAAALYSFNVWSAYRKLYPDAAADHLRFSKSIMPELKIRGTKMLAILASVVGSENAIRLKQWLGR
jgi:glycosyltransferase involved in cell wall biosynthesis